ncbi:hypothetical protein [Paenarthrobacter sp. PH39-S1]|nr:hypothetical protein [Paenarthrobacter sp. PH39-S1]MDJ0356394.1 hypothetical protein [Paenarthrobacter sp. PH39-S1]
MTVDQVAQELDGSVVQIRAMLDIAFSVSRKRLYAASMSYGN